MKKKLFYKTFISKSALESWVNENDIAEDVVTIHNNECSSTGRHNIVWYKAAEEIFTKSEKKVYGKN